MNLQDRNPSIDMQGEDVALIQRTLRKLKYDIPADEFDKQFFGSATRTQVMAFQERNGLEITGVVDKRTVEEMTRQVGELKAQPERLIVRGLVRQQDGDVLDGVTVQAFDKDLRREELLGKTTTNADGYYEISYTSDQFRRAEKGSADLSFQVSTSDKTQYAITDIIVNEASIPEPKVIFNAPAEVWANLIVVPQPEAQLSEYEQLLATLTPVLEDVQLADLTDEDVAFLVGETGIEQQRIEWLRKSAQLSRETNLQTEVFYGFARQNLPLNLKELLSHSTEDLRQALETAIEQNIIPASLRESLDQILARLKQLLEQLNAQNAVTNEFVGHLLDQETGKSLEGYTVRAFDLDAGEEPEDLGYDITNSEGIFMVSYTTPRQPEGEDTQVTERRLRLQILDPQGNEIHQTEIRVQIDQTQILEVRVPVPVVPEPPTPTVTELANTLQLDLPQALTSFLAERNIRTLADIRQVGGISQLEGLPVPVDAPIVQTLESHANLSTLSPDIQFNAQLINQGYTNIAAIAQSPRTNFVTAAYQTVGDFKAAQMQVVAKAQTGFLNNMLAWQRAELANNIDGTSDLESIPDLVDFSPARCECKDCEAAVSPLAYLADLLDYSLEHLQNNNSKITLQFLKDTFHQPFGDLPASCESMDKKVRQVRICIEVLRSYLRSKSLPAVGSSQQIALYKAEKDYRIATYTTLLSKLGTSYEEIRLARTANAEKREALAERLGIDLGATRPDNLDALFLDPSATPEQITEQVLEQIFGLVDTTRNPLASDPTSNLETWRLQHLRTLWKNQDFPNDLPTAGRPLIDPDVIGPDDFRVPTAKANPVGPDKAFDLWLRRRNWVDAGLRTLSNLTKQVTITINGQPQQLQVPDIGAMFGEMYKDVTYPSPPLKPWETATKPADFEGLREKLAQGIDTEATQTRIQKDLNLTAESFTRLVTIYAKYLLWENDPRSEKVKDEEWLEVYSILVQAQKVKLFSTWQTEEQKILFGPKEFWISLREPQEGDWPPLASQDPLIDPDRLKVADLVEPTVGKRALELWQDRKTRIEAITRDLRTVRETNGINGFDAMLRYALDHPNPGDPLLHDLTTLKNDLNNADANVVTSATNKIKDDLHLTVESFNRLMLIKAKNDDLDPQKKPTAAEWSEVYALLTPVRKIKHEFRIWITEEQNPTTGVVYWSALKAKLPRWRAPIEARQEWQQTLRIRSSAPLIDPDLIGPGDLKNLTPTPGNAAFYWQKRRKEVDDQLATLKTTREAAATPLAGLDTIIANTLGVSATDLLALVEERKKGNSIEGRVEQLNLTISAFSYLLRIRALINSGPPVLDSEWAEVYSILVQVQKRRTFTEWREEEKASPQNLTLGPDYFTFPVIDPLVFPPPPPPELPLWRAEQSARRDWQDMLQSRIDQEQAVIEALREAVSTTEELTLPSLRDALVLATDAVGSDLHAKAKWIGDSLLIDAKTSGCQKTTRIAQAIETIQALLFSVRTRQLNDTYPSLDLDADDFDKEWEWLGSYATWRAAMFVFIYPENILIPSLKKWKTPAFRSLVESLRSNRRLTPEQACEAANTYSEYYRDVCSLSLEASCQTKTLLHSGDCRSNIGTSYRPLFYMFARSGPTKKVYWSAHDPQDDSGFAQTFWEVVPGLEKSINVIGAVAYEIAPQERFIYLFARTQEGGKQKLVFTKYDLEKQKWAEEPTPLEPPKEKDQDTLEFTAVVKQSSIETNPPHLVIRIPNGAIYDRQLNREGSDWADGDWKPLIGRLLNSKFSEICAMVEIMPGEFYLIARDKSGWLQYRLFGVFWDDGFWRNLDDGSFRGVFSWPGSRDIYVFFNRDSKTAYFVLKRSNPIIGTLNVNSVPKLEDWLLNVPGVSLSQQLVGGNTLYSGMTFLQFFTLVREDDPNLRSLFSFNGAPIDFNSLPVNVRALLIQAVYANIYLPTARKLIANKFNSSENEEWKLADELVNKFSGFSLKVALNRAFNRTDTPFDHRDIPDELSPNFRVISGLQFIAPTSGAVFLASAKQFAYQQQTAGQVAVYRCNFNRDGDRLNQVSPTRIAPYVTGPFDITERISEDNLQNRAKLIESAFRANAAGPESNRTYLEEAYYFVPVHLALQLQSRGQYTAALDWFRTVYDYSMPVNQRKIYYGLIREEILFDRYRRADGWLLDPLNPHAIAASRNNTYTRFTLLAIIRCCLDLADAEFTCDTPESVPRARILYSTALELMDSPELKQRLGRCEKIIGTLNIEVGDPRWVTVWGDIRVKLAEIADTKVLETVVSQVRTVMAGDEPIAARLTQAKEIVSRAKAQLPAPPSIATVVQEKAQTLAQAHQVLLAQPDIAKMATKVGVIASKDFSYSTSLVTGKSVAALEREPLPWLRLQKTTILLAESTLQPTASVTAIAPSNNGFVARSNLATPTYAEKLAKAMALAPVAGVGIVRKPISTYIPAPSYSFCIPPNPILRALRLRVELNLYKLRNCRNIAGVVRELEPYVGPTDTVSGLPTIGAGGQLTLPGLNTLPPTQYRYAVLIERTKQLVSHAQQIEAALLATLEKRDAEYYNLLKARQDVRLTRAGVRLQDLRVNEAEGGVKLAELQQERAQIQVDHYSKLLDEGISDLESDSLKLLGLAADLQVASAATSIVASILPTSVGATGPTYSPQGSASALAGGFSSLAATFSTTASILSTLASYERRAQEWEFQKSIAQQDVRIGAQQVKLAEDRVRVVGQERAIAQIQAENAEVIADFLATKFTNVELYDWMSGILEQVYSFFLQQATSLAQLAANQLAFERQEVPPPFIQADYWEAPTDGAVSSNAEGRSLDRRGLTGSARLLQDIFQLDQYAFETNQRKLQLTKTISLSRLAPAEFQRFRETGVMTFGTPMLLFNQEFPGHYLRLIRKVRTSVIALIPAVQGIRATLSCTGTTRVVIGGDFFQTTILRRQPETIALTSPRDATGLFELEPQPTDLLLPFEGLGVDTTWEFRMPKAANLFDFSTIADVLVTIEYTALNSFDYRQQIIQTLPSRLSAERPFSFRSQFADQWYDLNNPEQTATPMTVKFRTIREDFPPNLDALKIQHIVLYFVRASSQSFEVPVTHLRFTETGSAGSVGGGSTSIDGIISTRRGNAGSWTAMIGKAPFGEWELALPNTEEIKNRFKDEEIEDILFVITYSGRTPEWPM